MGLCPAACQGRWPRATEPVHQWRDAAKLQHKLDPLFPAQPVLLKPSSAAHATHPPPPPRGRALRTCTRPNVGVCDALQDYFRNCSSDGRLSTLGCLGEEKQFYAAMALKRFEPKAKRRQYVTTDEERRKVIGDLNAVMQRIAAEQPHLRGVQQPSGQECLRTALLHAVLLCVRMLVSDPVRCNPLPCAHVCVPHHQPRRQAPSAVWGHRHSRISSKLAFANIW